MRAITYGWRHGRRSILRWVDNRESKRSDRGRQLPAYPRANVQGIAEIRTTALANSAAR